MEEFASVLYIVQLLYLMLPGIFANLAPIFAAKLQILKSLAKPVDFGRNWFDNRPILGSHKTFRGFLTGIAAAIAIAFIQFRLSDYGLFREISILNYPDYNFIVLGFLIGFGVLLGDSVKSFFKRRLGIMPGRPFFPFDQIDSVIGALALVSIVYVPSLGLVISLLFLTLFTHLLFRTIGYYLGISKERW